MFPLAFFNASKSFYSSVKPISLSSFSCDAYFYLSGIYSFFYSCFGTVGKTEFAELGIWPMLKNGLFIIINGLYPIPCIGIDCCWAMNGKPAPPGLADIWLWRSFRFGRLPFFFISMAVLMVWESFLVMKFTEEKLRSFRVAHHSLHHRVGVHHSFGDWVFLHHPDDCLGIFKHFIDHLLIKRVIHHLF